MLSGSFGKASRAVKAAHKEKGPHDSSFQIQVKVDGSTVMLDADAAWTAAVVKGGAAAQDKAAPVTATTRSRAPASYSATMVRPPSRCSAWVQAYLLEVRDRLPGGMPLSAIDEASRVHAMRLHEDKCRELGREHGGASPVAGATDGNATAALLPAARGDTGGCSPGTQSLRDQLDRAGAVEVGKSPTATTWRAELPV